jgi:hypothetical protein
VVSEWQEKILCSMIRIKKVFVLIHIACWILLSLLVALQLSQDNSYWPTLTAGFILTGLYIFYSHFFLLIIYSGKRKTRAYFLRLAGIVLTGPYIYLLFHYRRLDSLGDFLDFYMISLISFAPIFIFLSWLTRVIENLVSIQ